MILDLVDGEDRGPLLCDAVEELLHRRTGNEPGPKAPTAEAHLAERNLADARGGRSARVIHDRGVVEAGARHAHREAAPARPGRVVHPATADAHGNVPLPEVQRDARHDADSPLEQPGHAGSLLGPRGKTTRGY